MAMYDIKHSCGHVVPANITGPEAKRPARVDYLRSIPCEACVATAKAAEVAAANTGLPALEGTPKQIAWALKLRAEAVADAALVEDPVPHRQVAERISAYCGLPADDVFSRFEAALAMVTAARRKIVTETSARWWIDNRETVVKSVAAAERAAEEKYLKILNVAKPQEPARSVAAQPAPSQEPAPSPQESAPEPEEAPSLEGYAINDGSITWRGRDADFRLVGCDGRIAMGYVDGGDWAIYQVDGRRVPSTDAAAETLAAAAKRYFIG